MVNKGGLRYPKLMQAYQRRNPGYKFRCMKLKELGLERTNLLLSTSKLEKSGFKVRHINSVLDEAIL